MRAICPAGLAGCAHAPTHLSVHIYQTTLAAFQADIQVYRDAYGLPIVISEYACHVFDNNGQAGAQVSPEQASAFMRE